LPITDNISIAARNKSRPDRPTPAFEARVARLGKVIAPPRDKRKSNNITMSALISNDPKFISPPSLDRSLLLKSEKSFYKLIYNILSSY
jgi:hypothetical protein